MSKDDFGNRMKDYETVETSRRFMPLLPIYARIDGRCFSDFTRGMERPFDNAMSRIVELDMPIFTKVSNRVSVIFDGAAPEIEKINTTQAESE